MCAKIRANCYSSTFFDFSDKTPIFAPQMKRKRGRESPLAFFGTMGTELIKSKIEEWLVPILAAKNFFLVDVKLSLGGKKVEVYVDSDTGIQIDECAAISRQLEEHLDSSGLIPENYTLEVSSPGMSNPLRVPRQYKRRIGRTLEIVRTNGETFEAELLEANEDGIKLREKAAAKKKGKKVKGEEPPAPKEYELKYSDIKKATLQFNFK